MPQAVEDLEALREFIARDSPRYADLVTERLVTAVDIASSFRGQVALCLSTRVETFGSSCGHPIALSTASTATPQAF